MTSQRRRAMQMTAAQCLFPSASLAVEVRPRDGVAQRGEGSEVQRVHEPAIPVAAPGLTADAAAGLKRVTALLESRRGWPAVDPFAKREIPAISASIRARVLGPTPGREPWMRPKAPASKSWAISAPSRSRRCCVRTSWGATSSDRPDPS